ncbi:MAG: hypothetical protein R2706_09805 [Acidimicrobiales bacterium]
MRSCSAIGYDRASLAPEPVPQWWRRPCERPPLRDPVRQSTVWYCPAGSSSIDGFADHSVVVTNIGDTPVAAEVALVSGEGAGLRSRSPSPAYQRGRQACDLAMQAHAGAVVDIVGGNALVSHQVVTATARRAGRVIHRWPSSGISRRVQPLAHSHNYVVLLNPFSSDVVFTATFQTETRTREPSDLERAVVPARSVRVIDVGDYVA